MKNILAELLTIGDEILYGQIVDTNSQWMSVELSKVGVTVIRKTSVGDQILGALFVFVTLFMPKGIIGIPEQLRGIKNRLTRKRDGDEPRIPTTEANPVEKSAIP